MTCACGPIITELRREVEELKELTDRLMDGRIVLAQKPTLQSYTPTKHVKGDSFKKGQK